MNAQSTETGRVNARVLRKIALAFVDGDTLVRGPLIVANIDGDVQLRSYGEIIMRKNGVHVHAGVGVDEEMREENARIINEVFSFFGWYVEEFEGGYTLKSCRRIAYDANTGSWEYGEAPLHAKPHLMPTFAQAPEFRVVDRGGLVPEGATMPHLDRGSKAFDVEGPMIEVSVGFLTPNGRPSAVNLQMSAIATKDDPRFQRCSIASVTYALIQQVAYNMWADPASKKYTQTLRRQGRRV